MIRTSGELADIRFLGGTSFRTAGEQAQAVMLIRRLVVSAGITAADRPLVSATLKPLSGGRSAARVFRLTPYFGRGGRAKGSPVVVKMASRAQGLSEKANYDKFVREAVPVTCRPELLGFVTGRAGAGLCFALVGRQSGSGRSRPETLTDCLRRGEVAKLGQVLRGFIGPMRHIWYGPCQLRAERDIGQRYRDRYFAGTRAMSEAEEALLVCAARYFNARRSDGRCVIGRLSFPLPCALLFDVGRCPYRSCILHGDLNSDNIVIGGADNAAGVSVVDFQKTGRGHVYEDLIHVEQSIRINFRRDASFAEILEKERRIALGRRRFRNDPYCTSIRKIRDAAFGWFGRVEDEANYHFAIAAIGLRLMQATDLTHIARARITASTLWAAKVLAGEI